MFKKKLLFLLLGSCFLSSAFGAIVGASMSLGLVVDFMAKDYEESESYQDQYEFESGKEIQK